MSEYSEIVGRNLAAARKQAGLTQAQVAKVLGKYQPDYSKYERGILQLNYEQIFTLLKLFDIEANDLFQLN